MPLQAEWCGEMVLGLSRNPTVSPQRLFQRVLQPLHALRGHWCMFLLVVPFAHPYYMLWCCRDLAKRTCFGGCTLLVPDGCLVPGPDVVGLAGTELFAGLLGYGPVNVADQRLAVFPAAMAKRLWRCCLASAMMASSTCHHGWRMSMWASVMKAVSFRCHS